MPGVSATKPPAASGCSVTCVVVCRPSCRRSLTSAVRRFETGLGGAQQRRFAHARQACHRGGASGQRFAQRGQPVAGPRAGGEDAIAGPVIGGQRARQLGWIVIGLTGEIDLVDADDRRQIVADGGDQIAVHQLGPERRLAPGGHNQHLVHVSDDDLLQVGVEHVGAGQRARRGQHGLHQPAARGRCVRPSCMRPSLHRLRPARCSSRCAASAATCEGCTAACDRAAPPGTARS